MVIEHLHIAGFGALQEKDLSFGEGLNIIEGENESGKTTVAAFIRFMFYGFENQAEAARYTPAPSRSFGGSLDCTVTENRDGEEPRRVSYRIERSRSTADAVITELSTGEQRFAGLVPGEVFFGVNREIFVKTAFVGQVSALGGGGTRVDGVHVKDAIENILYAANESINPQAVIASLGEKRDSLYDAQAKRGTVYDMERERSALAARISSADNTNAEVKTLKDSIADCDSRIRKNTMRSEQLQVVYDKYQLYTAMDGAKEFDELRMGRAAAKKRAAALTKTMFRGSFVPDAAYAEALEECAQEMQAAKDEESSIKKEKSSIDFLARRDNLKEDLLRRVEMDGGVEVLQSRIESLHQKRAVMTVIGILFLIFLVFSCTTTAFLVVLQAQIVKQFLLISALLGVLCIIFFLSRNRYDKELSSILRRFSCETEDELENFFEEYVLSEKKLHKNTEQRAQADVRLTRCEERYTQAVRKASMLLSKLQPEGAPRLQEDRLRAEIVSSAAGRIRRTLAEIAEMEESALRCEEKLGEIARSFDTADENAFLEKRDALRASFGGKAAAEVDMEAVIRELDFNMKANAALEERKKTLEGRLRAYGVSAGGTQREDTAVLGGLLEELDERLRSDRRMYGALTYAIEKMQTASNHLHDAIAPKLMSNAGMLMRVLSDWRYTELALDDNMEMVFGTKSKAEADGQPDHKASTEVPKTMEQMSAGTQDIAYLSLRMALIHMLYVRTMPPLLFDEAFAMLDDKRLSRMTELLFSVTDSDTAAQALVFTCHKRERHAAEALREGEEQWRVIHL